jgi:hypothetical protein
MIPILPAQADVMAAADAVCAADPIQAAIRDEMLHIETHGTEDGYDYTDITNTMVFQMAINHATGQAASTPLRTLSHLVWKTALTFGCDIPRSLDMVSAILANPELSTVAPVDTIKASIHRTLHEYDLEEGWEVYGVGVVSIAQSVRADTPEMERMTTEELESYENLVPVWYAHMVGTDSRVWSVLHQEGYAVVYGVTGADEPTTGVSELGGLMRLLNATVVA